MQHRKRTALIAGLFTITCLAQISMNTMSGISADAAGSYDMAVTVNLAGEKKAISPHIYGVNDSGDGSNLKNVTGGLCCGRQSRNRSGIGSSSILPLEGSQIQERHCSDTRTGCYRRLCLHG